MHYTATFRTHSPLQAAGVQHFFLDDDEPLAAGSLPDRLSAVSGPQERVQRRMREVPVLDAPVPQTVDVMVEVLTCFDKPSSVEQVVEMPTIDFLHRVPLRTVLRETQTVEQLVDVPVPQTALLALGTSATGVAWRQMLATGRGGVLVAAAYFLAPPSGMDRQPRVVCEYWAGLRRLRLSRTSL